MVGCRRRVIGLVIGLCILGRLSGGVGLVLGCMGLGIGLISLARLGVSGSRNVYDDGEEGVIDWYGNWVSSKRVKEKKVKQVAEPTTGPKKKDSTFGSSKGTKPQPKSFGKFVQSEEPVFEVADSDMPQD
ncbi:hypothetical protein Tco_0860635 [Tanacetum coccineum]|uniref:Uncharacterized protein n=1 Tax=Tanacetum coccineum TaxID=301880 RepID=A0ABQ5BJ96_9ASTR